MLKGGAILVVVAITLLITLLISSLVLFSYYKRLETNNNLMNMRLVKNANSGMQLLLSDEEFVATNDSTIVDLYDEREDSVTLARSDYGLFEIHTARAFHQNLSYSKTAMIGRGIAGVTKSALFLPDNNKPLFLCGNTLLIGDCYLPEAGLKRAYIEGQSFVGDQLMTGNVLKGGKTLPAVNKERLNRLTEIMNSNGSIVADDSYVEWQEIANDSLSNSFYDDTRMIYSNSSMVITNRLSGNIILVAKDSILIKSSSQLHNVVLLSPLIRFEKGTKATLQAFSQDAIIVSQECYFKYPTVLGAIKDTPEGRGMVEIDSSSMVEGLVFSYKSYISNALVNAVTIEKDAVVYGQVYSNGSLDMKGAVYGNVICDHFILKTSSSVYEQHLLNAEIDATKIDEAFALPLLLDDKQINKIVQWLK